ITVGAGGRGEITTRIQKAFFEITKGEREAPGDWLTYVNPSAVKADNNGHKAQEVIRSSSSTGNEPAVKYQTAAIE
ncbi:MAG TPA: hypothetical protein VFD48_09815, partial [Pyrinomonadaceae bacterium]|nr:hypothetical protein [Pyrinomonadaceae bacterium]